ncbi:MAG: hypothetical protein ACD_48C00362G0003 [uncultured bacterium]|nr:MAG: hypothetical protein ACD_48C00362G0003 [uncultured bacterium]
MKNNKLVYFSGSVLGKLNQPQQLAIVLVNHIRSKGVEVLDVYAASRKYYDESEEIQKAKHQSEPWFTVETVDINDIDRSTHLIALVNGPSHGVGMEIQRAVDNVEMGKSRIKILCLVQERRLKEISWMIRGKQKKEYPNFSLKTYKNLEDAKKIVDSFLDI